MSVPELSISWEIKPGNTPTDVTFTELYEIGAFLYECDQLLETIANLLSLFLRNIRTERNQLHNWEEEDWVAFHPEDEFFPQAMIRIHSPLLQEPEMKKKLQDFVLKSFQTGLPKMLVPVALSFIFSD